MDAVKRSGPVVPSPPWNRVPPRGSVRRRDPLNRKANHLLISVVNGFTVDETDEASGRAPAGQLAPGQLAVMTRDYLASLPASEFPNLVALTDQFAISDQDLASRS